MRPPVNVTLPALTAAERPAIVLERVSRTYSPRGGGAPVEALRDLSLSVEAGAIVGLIGASGAGKSTLLRLIGGVDLPSAGRVAVDGLAGGSGGMSRSADRVALVPETVELIPARSVLDNVARPLEGLGLPRWQAGPKAAAVLADAGLGHLRDRFPDELSAGERSRVALARALVTEPAVLLADEPFAALDRDSVGQLLRALEAANRRGTTVIIASRSSRLVQEIAHEIVVIDAGRVLERGATYEVLTRPREPLTRTRIGSAFAGPLPEFLVEKLGDRPTPGGQAIVRLVFTGSAATTPVITGLARNLGLDVNILVGAAETVRGRLYGVLIVGVAAGEPYLSAALSHFRDAGLEAEVLGYLD